MTRRVLPCLICGGRDHSSASCTSPLARVVTRTGRPRPRSIEPRQLGNVKYLQGYLDNPPNMHLRKTKVGHGIDYRADEYRGYESWQFRVTPLGRWDR